MNHKTILVVAVSAALAACGGGSDSSSTPSTSITTTSQASSVASTSSQAITLASGSLSLTSIAGAMAGTGAPLLHAPLATNNDRFNKLLAAHIKTQQLAQAAVAHATQTQTAACTTSGSKTIDLTTDDATGAVVAMSVQFTACIENGEKLDGMLALTAGSAGSVSIKMGGGNGVLGDGNDFMSEQYDAATGAVVSSTVGDLTLSMSSSSNTTGVVNFSMTLDGKLGMEDANGAYTVAYQKFSASGSDTTNPDGTGSSTFKLDGSMSEQMAQANGSVQGITVSLTKLAMNNSYSSSGESVSVNGGLAIDYNPDVACANGGSADGSFTIATVTPMYVDFAVGHTTAGKLTINSTTEVVYNSDGSVTVTVAGASQKYASEDELQMICPLDTPTSFM